MEIKGSSSESSRSLSGKVGAGRRAGDRPRGPGRQHCEHCESNVDGGDCREHCDRGYDDGGGGGGCDGGGDDGRGHRQ